MQIWKQQEFDFNAPYPNPESDDQALFNLQQRFKDGDADALTAMYKKLYEIAYKAINTESRKNAHIAGQTAIERQQKAHDAATYLIEQYLKRPTFTIRESMTGYLWRRVQFELYGKGARKVDKMLVFCGDVPEEREAVKHYYYAVTDTHNGKTAFYYNSEELYLNPEFKGLRKKRLAECINTGRQWKNYLFDLLEINE